ncbi:MAG: RNA-guided pseudouridylation complex pseudouridine synthase subunit Cbf5 [archaeon]
MAITQLPFEKISRQVLTRVETKTSEKYGKKPEDRSVSELLDFGIINVDKPAGPTSHQVSAYLQNILGIDKSGHSGTLDPQVTGCLPIGLGKSTKIVHTLLKAGKEYIALMHLHSEVSRNDLNDAIEAFTGKIRQLPPIKSAVKREWRERSVYYFEIIEFVDGQDVLFRVGTEAGTYIRKLIHDIGQHIGCGAHMAQLRRSKVGPFNESTLFILQDVSDAFYYYKKDGNEKFIRKIIQPIETAVAHLPKIWVMDTTVDSLCHGASLGVPGIAKLEEKIEPDQLVAVMSLKDELVCYGRAKLATKQMMGEKGLAFIPDKVLMEPGTYPKIPLRA